MNLLDILRGTPEADSGLSAGETQEAPEFNGEVEFGLVELEDEA